jgi:alpha-1,3-rhamnosyl/mannosyltransferase
MRIAVSGLPIAAGQRTGIGNYVLNLLSALAESSEIEELSLALWGQMVPAREFMAAIDSKRPARATSLFRQAPRAILRHMPYGRWLLALVREFRLRYQFRRQNYTLFHEPNYAGPHIGRPLVTTVCDMGYIRFPEFMPKDRVAWLRKDLKPRLDRSSTVITISDFVRNELLELLPTVPPNKVFVTHLGVCSKQFNNNPDSERVEKLRADLNLPEKFFLFLGTLEPRKNLQGLLSAFALLPREVRREYPLVLAGANGWQQHYFRAMMDNLVCEGSLQVVGYVDAADVPLLLKAATVFCFPSHYEGFGLPALEAAACGTPVLCSHAASLPEVLGDAALYVDPNSVESIAEGMSRLINDAQLRRVLSTRGPRRALEFSWHKCGQSTLQAYRATTGMPDRKRAAA